MANPNCTECHGSGILRDEELVAECPCKPECSGETPLKWIVQVKQNLTACDTVFRGGPTQRLLSQEVFHSEELALEYYKSQKNIFRFAGLAGQYVTYPQQREPEEIFPHHCDECGQGFNEDTYADINGQDYCSKSCVNTDRSEPQHFEERYEDDY